ncbi:hypothetical protein GF342_06090 [Candidatus Woesearchaeota archaeon]|nr:hypothetical protein [Candidatus Woesearchaeota archaeon]
MEIRVPKKEVIMRSKEVFFVSIIVVGLIMFGGCAEKKVDFSELSPNTQQAIDTEQKSMQAEILGQSGAVAIGDDSFVLQEDGTLRHTTTNEILTIDGEPVIISYTDLEALLATVTENQRIPVTITYTTEPKDHSGDNEEESPGYSVDIDESGTDEQQSTST